MMRDFTLSATRMRAFWRIFVPPGGVLRQFGGIAFPISTLGVNSGHYRIFVRNYGISVDKSQE